MFGSLSRDKEFMPEPEQFAALVLCEIIEHSFFPAVVANE